MNRPTGRALPVVAAIMAVAVLVVGASVLQGLATARRDATTPSASTPPADPVAPLDLGQVTSREQVAGCLTPRFAADPAGVDLLYGVQQRKSRGSEPVFVLRNQAGDLRLCDQFGGDGVAESSLPTVTDTRPVAFLSTGRRSWECAPDSDSLERFRMTQWLRVAPEVRTVQQRYWIGDRPGSWFSTEAQNGYVHLQSWLQGPHPADTRYGVQYRVLGTTGQVVEQRTLPTGRQSLPGCAGRTSTELG